MKIPTRLIKTPRPGAAQPARAGASAALYQPAPRRACALATLAVMVSGCGAPPLATQPAGATAQTQVQTPLQARESALPEPAAPAATAPRQALRVIVRFRPGAPYRDGAFLQAMGQKVQARITYLASVSDDTHVYRIEPGTGLGEAEMVRRLADLPPVLCAEPEARVRPQ